MAVIKTIDLVGVSEVSWDDAARQALKEAAKTIRRIESVDVLEMTATVGDEGEFEEFHTSVRINFRLDR